MKYDKKLRVYLFLVFGLVFCCIGGCQSNDKVESVNYDELFGSEDISESILSMPQTTIVGRGDVVQKQLYSGILAPYAEELSFPAEGVFGAFNVTLGQKVKKGEILAVTDIESTQKRLDLLQEQLKSLEDNYAYQMSLYNIQLETLKIELDDCYIRIENLDYLSKEYTAACVQAGVLDEEIERTKLKIRQFQENYDFEKPYLETQITSLKKDIKGNVIKAPFDGVVVQLTSMLKGDLLEKGKPCIVLADEEKYCVVADYLPKTTAEKAEKFEMFLDGNHYDISYEPLDSKIYSDLIQKSENAYSTYSIYSELVDEHFDFGKNVLVSVTVKCAKDVIMVSNLGIHRDGSQYYCYVLRDGKKEKVFLTIGLKDAIHTEVISGLKEGDEVYIE